MPQDQPPRRIRMAIPSHSLSMAVATTELMLRLQSALLTRGDAVEFEFYSGAVIADVRNAMVADFLHSGADLLLMIDSDMAAPAEVVLRLIDAGRDVVGCLYPRRQFDWSRVQPPSPTGASYVETALHQAMSFVGVIEMAQGKGAFEMVEGFARALHVGTGILAIRREVFLRLAESYPDLSQRGFAPSAFAGPRFTQNWGFFNPITPRVGAPLSEDYSFCQRWRAIGGEVWADVASRITHIGVQPFTGSFLEFLKANQP